MDLFIFLTILDISIFNHLKHSNANRKQMQQKENIKEKNNKPTLYI